MLLTFAGLRGPFSVFALQKHRYLRRSQKREVVTTPLSQVKSHGLLPFFVPQRLFLRPRPPFPPRCFPQALPQLSSSESHITDCIPPCAAMGCAIGNASSMTIAALGSHKINKCSSVARMIFTKFDEVGSFFCQRDRFSYQLIIGRR